MQSNYEKFEEQILFNQMAIMSALGSVMVSSPNSFTDAAVDFMTRCADATANILGVDLEKKEWPK